MALKDILMISGIVVNLILIVSVLIKIVFGQGKAKAREEQHSKDIEHIKGKLDNHIEHLQCDVTKILGLISGVVDRVSKVEGRLNGVKKE